MQEKDILEIPAYLRPYFSEEPQFHYYEEYKKHVSAYRKISNRFICLKGFSSSTPLVNSVAFDSNSMGGGFFFNYNGVGIAVDPGISFVTLMHKNNIFIDDIDIVIVTHAHIDHNCDVASLSSLLYDYNRNLKARAKVYSDYLGYSESTGHTIEWFLDDTTLSNTRDILDKQPVHRLADLLSHTHVTTTPTGATIEFSSIRTKHIKDCNDSFGLKLTFKSAGDCSIWGYTSDTTYFNELDSYYAECDVLLLNISDIYIKDVARSKPKRSHLGFAGCRELIASVQPRLALITEFCCTNGDYRFEIVRALREKIGHGKTLILPAEIGCKISIAAIEQECSLCKKDICISEMKAVRPTQEFERIQYVCPYCLL